MTWVRSISSRARSFARWLEILAMPKRFSFLSEGLDPDDMITAMGASIG